CHQYNSLPWTF
nr:immunoglobulin light chain junction region [Macaca mulatta]MOX86296.1 immunoglobulin light chain junction region [Macaca mulatta]MOX86952.1 immunoglobulin light chain junction region [Macaca mulatta]MOX86974.1 immunoglobulin light chain junction region [Macaca mulatta]MOX89625.1 immunoglobulin light chain junction region [Macaca mulatta]